MTSVCAFENTQVPATSALIRCSRQRRPGLRTCACAGSRDAILIRSPSLRGIAEEAPGAYKDVTAVVDAADRAGLSRTVARLEPLVCVKG